MANETVNAKQEVLNTLFDLLNDLNVRTEFIPAEGDGDVDTVVSEYDEIGSGSDEMLGEFFFLPDENMEYSRFVISFTLDDDLAPGQAAKLYKAIAMINFYLPQGALVISPDETVLSYRNVVGCDSEMDAKALTKFILPQIDQSAALMDLWLGILMAYKNELITEEDFEAALAAFGTEEA